MKTFVITEPGRTEVIQQEEPKPGAGEVLLDIAVVGICGSDLSTYRGKNPMVNYPRIPGHELGCTVLEVGADVPDHICPGQQVMVSPFFRCNKCTACRQKRYNCCRHNDTLGVQQDGAMREQFVVSWENVLVNERLSLSELAMVEPLSIGFHASGRGRLTSEDTVAVLGCGMIGLGCIVGAVKRGGRVIAVDLDDGKLELAERLGAARTINAASQSLHDELQELTKGEGPQVIMEAVGTPDTFRSAVEEVCFGGRVVYVGYVKAPVEYETKWFIQKELDILGSRNAVMEDFETVIETLEHDHLPVNDIITQTVSIDEAGKALKAWDEDPGSQIKIQVLMP